MTSSQCCVLTQRRVLRCCSAGCVVLVSASTPATAAESSLVAYAAAEKSKTSHLKTADTDLDLLAVHILQHGNSMTEAKVILHGWHIFLRVSRSLAFPCASIKFKGLGSMRQYLLLHRASVARLFDKAISLGRWPSCSRTGAMIPTL